MLITSSSYELDTRRHYPALASLPPTVHLIIDEAQAFGGPADALPLCAWAKRARSEDGYHYWGTIHQGGDPFQPHGGSPCPPMQRLLLDLFERAPGIRNPDIQFLPPPLFLATILAEKHVPAQLNPLLAAGWFSHFSGSPGDLATMEDSARMPAAVSLAYSHLGICAGMQRQSQM